MSGIWKLRMRKHALAVATAAALAAAAASPAVAGRVDLAGLQSARSTTSSS